MSTLNILNKISDPNHGFAFQTDKSKRHLTYAAPGGGYKAPRNTVGQGNKAPNTNAQNTKMYNYGTDSNGVKKGIITNGKYNSKTYKAVNAGDGSKRNPYNLGGADNKPGGSHDGIIVTAPRKKPLPKNPYVNKDGGKTKKCANGTVLRQGGAFDDVKINWGK